MRGVVKLFLSLLVILGMSGCLPFEHQLQVMLNQHNISKKIYLKNDTVAYDGYHSNKKVIVSLKRAERFNIVDIKHEYARLAQSKDNKLTKDVWVKIDELEVEPTYFLHITTNTTHPKITIEGKIYKSNMRLPKGEYELNIGANKFLNKKIKIKIDKDIDKKIDLDFDVKAEKKRLAIEKIRAAIRAQKEKIAQELKTSIYIDKQQKLTWQDNKDTIILQKPWITKINYNNKKYNDTSGDTAKTYCKQLKLAGFNNWRLASKDELKNLYTQKHLLKNTISGWYWSSTNNEKISSRAWAIYLNNGDGYSDNKNTINYVRCVR